MVNPFAYSFVASLMISPCLQGKDLGTHGEVRHIEEKDLLEEIKEKLHLLQERGELERYQQKLISQVRASLQRPIPLKNITSAEKNRTFTYDPSFTLGIDIKGPNGELIHGKGKHINPLNSTSLSHDLLFIDGDDEAQKSWAYQYIQNPDSKIKVILIKGAPLELSEEWERVIYFDQGGILTKKLGILHVPARVSQDGKKLKIEEIKLEELRE